MNRIDDSRALAETRLGKNPPTVTQDKDESMVFFTKIPHLLSRAPGGAPDALEVAPNQQQRVRCFQLIEHA